MTGGPEQGQLGSYCSNPGRVHSGFHQSNDSKDDEQQLNLETFFFFFEGGIGRIMGRLDFGGEGKGREKQTDQ